jgi:hypothetical protein
MRDAILCQRNTWIDHNIAATIITTFSHDIYGLSILHVEAKERKAMQKEITWMDRVRLQT